ncbi:MAG TPA: cyanophycinase [Methylibium sp.]|uniref:cyanophycinase n=1 Tax=Methylibium sp. TaxID=2067992 RepID=UPI002DB8606D|nr:cyanophycinase [Methylibium sp.]HEU4457614.1 cyanophycinase [Methylibium sp.]
MSFASLPLAYGRRLLRALLFPLLAGLGACAVAESSGVARDGVEERDPVPHQAGPGYAVPIGGALKYDNQEVWSRLVQLSGGEGARWVVVPTAAGNPMGTGSRIAEALKREGAKVEVLPISPRLAERDAAADARSPALVAKVRAAHGVFFAGGAQERIVDVLQPGGVRTPLLEAIWELFDAGGVVAGTSAGAAIMSETMFRDATDVLRVLKTGKLDEGKEIDRGLGFVGPELFVDQHFLKRGRIGRMLPLMVKKGYKLGIGVEENTGAIVRGHEIEVIGAKGVLLVDLSAASSDAALPFFNLKNARITYLDKGDRHDFKTGVTTPSQEKLAGSAIDPGSADFRPYFRRMPFVPDILGDNAIANTMGNLIDNRQNEALGLAFAGIPLADDPQPDLGFEFRLKRGPESRGWYTGAFGGEDYTVLNLNLDVTPVRMRRPLYEPMNAAAPPASLPAAGAPAAPVRNPAPAR